MRIACQQCDLLIDLPSLAQGEGAHCPRCEHLVAWRTRGGLRLSLACLIAAAVLFLLACSYPFLSFESRGFGHEVALWQVVHALYTQGMPVVAVAVGLLILIVPTALMLLHLLILVPVLGLRRLPPHAIALLRASHYLTPWSMVEIFAVGTLASLTKIASLATVYFGVAFWAYLGFCGLFAVSLVHFDRRQLWDMVPSRTACRASAAEVAL